MTDPVIVRPCRRRDLRQLEFGSEHAHDRALIRRMFRRHLRAECCFLVAEVQSRAIGQCWIEYPRSPARTGAIWALRVHAPFRARGVGRQLMLASFSVLSAAGAAEAEIELTPGNAAARRLYQRLGFAPAEGPPRCPPPGPPLPGLIVMRRPLHPGAQEAA